MVTHRNYLLRNYLLRNYVSQELLYSGTTLLGTYSFLLDS